MTMNDDIKKVKEFCKKAKVSPGLMKLAVENIKEFKLKAEEIKGPQFLGEMMADSNLGGTGDGRMLRSCEVDPYSEIEAWVAVYRTAEMLAEKLKVQPTNLILMYLAHHPKAEKAWASHCK